MKRRSLWITSILSLLVVTTLAFQNCNNKKFNAAGSASLDASMLGDGNGVINGEVISEHCDEEEEVANCPAATTVNVYAIESDNSRTFIGDTQATLREKIGNGGVKSYSYIFSFPVPVEHKCKDIEVRAVDPITQVEQVFDPIEGSVIWGSQAGCQPSGSNGGSTGGSNGGSTGGSTGGSNGGSTAGSNNGGANGGSTGGGTTPVEISGTRQDGRLVEIYGTCKSGTTVKMSGDLNTLITKDASCTSGAFKHCDFLNNRNSNSVTAKQTVGATISQDTVSITGRAAPIVFTFDSFVKSGTTITTSGKCTPGGVITLTIYNANVATFSCPSSGMYTNTGNHLVAGLSDRVMFGKLETVDATAEIKADVDSENVTPVCGADLAFVPRTDYSTKQAGKVTGKCTIGLPVHVSVNGNKQNIGYCPSGTFTINNVLVPTSGVNASIMIEQVSPFGRSCSRTITTSL